MRVVSWLWESHSENHWSGNYCWHKLLTTRPARNHYFCVVLPWRLKKMGIRLCVILSFFQEVKFSLSLSLVYCLIGVSEFSYLFTVIDINFGTAFGNDLSFAQTWKSLVVSLILWMNKPTWEQTNILQIAGWWEVCSYIIFHM